MPGGLMRKAILLVGALGIAGCSGVLEPRRPVIGVSYNLWSPLAVATELHVAIDRQNLWLPAPEGQLRSESSTQVRARRYGDMPVRIAVLTITRDTLAAVQITHHLERDNAHWIGAQISDWRPQG